MKPYYFWNNPVISDFIPSKQKGEMEYTKTQCDFKNLEVFEKNWTIIDSIIRYFTKLRKVSQSSYRYWNFRTLKREKHPSFISIKFT